MVHCRSAHCTLNPLQKVGGYQAGIQFGDLNLILSWTSSTATEAPEALTQWGHSIIIAGDPKKVTGSKRKSFMVDMYGFKMDGELAGVSSYLRSHGGFEIGQVLA